MEPGVPYDLYFLNVILKVVPFISFIATGSKILVLPMYTLD